MKNECPTDCVSGQGLREVTSSELKLTPLILAASRVQEGDQLLLCDTCGRVVRRSFDSYLLHFRLESLGTFRPNLGRFEPKPWLQHEMERLTKVSLGNASLQHIRKPKTDERNP
jgi:hypothetical protein